MQRPHPGASCFFTLDAEDVSRTPAPPLRARTAAADDVARLVAATMNKPDAVLSLKIVERRSLAGNPKLRHFDSAEHFAGIGTDAKRRSGEAALPHGASRLPR